MKAGRVPLGNIKKGAKVCLGRRESLTKISQIDRIYKLWFSTVFAGYCRHHGKHIGRAKLIPQAMETIASKSRVFFGLTTTDRRFCIGLECPMHEVHGDVS